MKSLIENRKARYSYEISDRFEAGIVLTGSEVKSLKKSQGSIKEAYIVIKNNELYIQNMSISDYQNSSDESDSYRLKKLICHKHEITKIRSLVEKKSYSCIPLRVYLKKRLIKIEIGIGKGKTGTDKRESLKKKIHQREMQKQLKNKIKRKS